MGKLALLAALLPSSVLGACPAVTQRIAVVLPDGTEAPAHSVTYAIAGRRLVPVYDYGVFCDGFEPPVVTKRKVEKSSVREMKRLRGSAT